LVLGSESDELEVEDKQDCSGIKNLVAQSYSGEEKHDDTDVDDANHRTQAKKQRVKCSFSHLHCYTREQHCSIFITCIFQEMHLRRIQA
jgi:hypothetical protein